MTRATILAKRLALVALGALLGLAVLEAGLQAGALALRLTGQRMPTTWLSGRQRILCLGDSNTYGLYLTDRAQAYPQQLEQLWNASASTASIEVLNLGYPGTNSSRLRRDLPHMLETLRPDVVIIMVGSNDYWTARARAREPSSLPDRAGQFIKRYSRVYQLAYMLAQAFDRRQLEVEYPMQQAPGSVGILRVGDAEFEMGFKKGARRRDHDAELVSNLRALADIAHSFGAEPVFMTYPSGMWNYGDANLLIRAAAAAAGVRLVDLASVFQPVCPQEPCPEWLYADHHPTAKGYHKIGEVLVRELHDVL